MPDFQLHNEKELLAGVAMGDRKAYTVLYAHYFPRLYRFVFFVNKSHEEAEEIIQNCLLRVWERKETLIGIQSFDSYLFRMAKNELFDRSKRSALKKKIFETVTEFKPLQDNIVEKQIIYNEYFKAATEAIELLSPRKKEIFLLSTREELSLDEIAAHLRISRALVKKELYASVKLIKQFLQKNAGWILSVSFFVGN